MILPMEHLTSLAEYEALYRESITDPASFWGRAASSLDWFAPWSTVLKSDFSTIGETEAPYVQFFKDGKLNASYNCLDRHLAAGRGHQVALYWQGEPTGDRRSLTYAELHREVCRFAQVLLKHGVGKGDTVTIFLPMTPEAVIAMLACARIGAVHSVVFSAFSEEALAQRINDCGSKLVITADASFYAGKTIRLKDKVDAALARCPIVQRVIVFNRANQTVSMDIKRDVWWHEEMQAPDISDDFPATWMDAEDPLFILYTSGSTGKPKGVVHTTGGYLLYAHLTFKLVFNVQPDDIHYCTADVGWITGHSYVVYGPLATGTTIVMYEGAPTTPEPDRFWQIIEDYKATIFYTAPTAIRTLMRLGDEWVRRHDLSSLRVLGSVGEPINPKAWQWYHDVVGGSRCPVVDTWWQTETGGIMISPLAHVTPLKAGSATLPFFGVAPEIINGELYLTTPWPGMTRGMFGDTQHSRMKQVYFSRQPGKYFTGDGAFVDEDGFYWLQGRVDDEINVSAHRFATAEIESALVAHPAVAEAAVVGRPHSIKGQAIYCFVTLKANMSSSPELEAELVKHVRSKIGPIATPDAIHFTVALPKTRSGKIMRRVLRGIAAGDLSAIGDISTLADQSVVDQLWAERKDCAFCQVEPTPARSAV